MKKLLTVLLILFSFVSFGQKVIKTQIDGEFEGWEGETIFKLMNGQIWQQAEYDYMYHYDYMPDVVIYKTESGYRMRVEGLDETIAVYQIY